MAGCWESVKALNHHKLIHQRRSVRRRSIQRGQVRLNRRQQIGLVVGFVELLIQIDPARIGASDRPLWHLRLTRRTPVNAKGVVVAVNGHGGVNVDVAVIGPGSYGGEVRGAVDDLEGDDEGF